MAAEQVQLQVHNVTLDTETRALTGPRGHIQLAPQLFSLAERLFRRPQAIIPETTLISAIYPDPDREPETASVVLRIRISSLRHTLMVISSDRVRIRTERGSGWGLSVVL